MAKKRIAAKSIAQPFGLRGFSLSHAAIIDEDYEWLASAERLTLWNVQVPLGFLARLEKLWWLDIRGGSATDLEVARGAKKLQYLAVNQVHGLSDLSLVSEMISLRYLDLYGLRQVTHFPSCSNLSKLEHASLGQMRGLLSLRELLQAPQLVELLLIRKVNIAPDDVEAIIRHPTIKRFDWFAEDVPEKTWMPIVKKIALPPVPIRWAADWFELSEAVPRWPSKN